MQAAISICGRGAGKRDQLHVDGGDNLDTFSNVNLPIPFPDALQEFPSGDQFPASGDTVGCALINPVTKSGTNALRAMCRIPAQWRR